MAEKYISVAGEHVTEKVIEKSRFITTSNHIESDKQAKNFISEVKYKFADATHSCYAYVADKTGNFLRFSDDGEPQGTAGLPMLEVLKNNSLFETAVVVTRYFGGIKLGAGGLVRAYSGCVSENIASARKVMYLPCAENRYVTDYPFIDRALRYIEEYGADLISSEYSNEAVFTVAVKKSEEQTFNGGFVNRLNGKLKIEKLKEYFYPFKI